MAHFVELDQGDQIELSGAARLAVVCKTGRRTRLRIDAGPHVEIVRVRSDPAETSEQRSRANQERQARRERHYDRQNALPQDHGDDHNESPS